MNTNFTPDRIELLAKLLSTKGVAYAAAVYPWDGLAMGRKAVVTSTFGEMEDTWLGNTERFLRGEGRTPPTASWDGDHIANLLTVMRYELLHRKLAPFASQAHLQKSRFPKATGQVNFCSHCGSPV